MQVINREEFRFIIFLFFLLSFIELYSYVAKLKDVVMGVEVGSLKEKRLSFLDNGGDNGGDNVRGRMSSSKKRKYYNFVKGEGVLSDGKFIEVEIRGGVRKPGIYKLNEGTSLYELLRLSYLDGVELKGYKDRILRDGETIYIR